MSTFKGVGVHLRYFFFSDVKNVLRKLIERPLPAGLQFLLMLSLVETPNQKNRKSNTMFQFCR